MFLHTIGHNVRNSTFHVRFGRSQEAGLRSYPMLVVQPIGEHIPQKSEMTLNSCHTLRYVQRMYIDIS
uniref:Uncharacterized protein n=1 Tax=Nelumbo nucifera TaxID=4432 RepID=A0A822Z6H3_NELNU|nr:TPA_asm: hypothetical protein HUJ06_007769 [Nelumbo nucifera]